MKENKKNNERKEKERQGKEKKRINFIYQRIALSKKIIPSRPELLFHFAFLEKKKNIRKEKKRRIKEEE